MRAAIMRRRPGPAKRREWFGGEIVSQYEKDDDRDEQQRDQRKDHGRHRRRCTSYETHDRRTVQRMATKRYASKAGD